MTTSDKTASRKKSVPPKDPYLDLKVGDHVMMSSPLVDPTHWYLGKVLYRDTSDEILIQNWDFNGKHQRVLVDLHHVRAFGTKDHVQAEQRRASQTVRVAADLAREIEDMAGDLRRKLVDLFEQVAARALEAAGTAA